MKNSTAQRNCTEVQLTLEEFTDEVNRLCQEACEEYNSRSRSPVFREHDDFPSLLLARYYDASLTLHETRARLQAEAQQEVSQEARVS